MSLIATIIVPTYDHGPLLRYSVGSALHQTVPDIEVFIVGDGMPGEAREVVDELLRADPRVRFFDHPKGPRHGEIYRHQALAEAKGRIVCYLSDDDLWLPRHVEEMSSLLEEADFAHALANMVLPDSRLHRWVIDLSIPSFQHELIEGRNRIPLSAGAHTLEAYRRLGVEWSSAPLSIPTDLHMWQKFLARSDCRFRAGTIPTVFVFPALDRRHMTLAERISELEEWSDKIAREPDRLSLQVLRERVSDAAATEARLLDTLWGRGSAVPELLVQLFLPDPAGHTESNSIRLSVPSSQWTTVEQEFLYPQTDVPIRIDPGSFAGLIRVSAIRVTAENGTVHGPFDDRVRVGGTACLLKQAPELTVLSYGHDPQILLPSLSAPEQRVKLDFRLRADLTAAAVAAACRTLCESG
ncbi:MAG TPA: glycosyltransferase family A protein [Bryobacteraceae bacterium]|nr:glycosyltransferase family A protein [Bryobacteraceae bacterium]